MINVKEAATKELVEFYNEHADKPVKKFSDRKTAERRVSELLEELEGHKVVVIGPEDFDDDFPSEYDAPTSVPMKPRKGKTTSLTRSEAIAKSWTVPETAEKRSQRSAVEVDGQVYRSVRAAFEALGLPMKHHIPFRMDLKAAGTSTDFGHKWKIIPLNYGGKDE